MVTLQDAQIDDDEDAQIQSTDLIPNSNPNPNFPIQSDPMPMKSTPGVEPMVVELAENPGLKPVQEDSRNAVKNESLDSGVVEKIVSGKVEQLGSEEVSSDSITECDDNNNSLSERLVCEKISEGDEYVEEVKKSFSADQSDATMEEVVTPSPIDIVAHSNGHRSKKSSKKKNKCYSVWLKPTSRKGKKKAKNFNGNHNHSNVGSHTAPKMENSVLLTPFPRLLYKSEDSPGAKIVLSKVHKAEKVELSEDRLSARSSKGYRMVRTTRGVIEGAWFFEIKVVNLGETGHSRLGWSTEKGDLEAPVGYDGFSYGYRDVDGSKVHKALREKYGDEGYKEGDVIGFYINLPEGASFAPKRPKLVVYKGQKYVCASDTKEEPPKCVPGSEISFFKNGICQGVAFKDLCGGCYYPAASMYTLPNQPNCVVKFNFGPDFECFPADFGSRPVPKPMIEAPYHGSDNPSENGVLDESKQ